jgi:hypothetical protein
MKFINLRKEIELMTPKSKYLLSNDNKTCDKWFIIE